MKELPMNISDLSTSSTPQPNISSTLDPSICQRCWPPCGIVPTFILIFGIRALFGLVGVTLNLDLIYVTITRKSLHHTCKYLIALSSLGSAIYQLGYFPVYAILFNGWSQVRQDTCFLLQALPLFGKTFSLAMLLAIGFDRLRAVTIGWHLRTPGAKLLYCLFWSALCSTFGVYFLVVCYWDIKPETLVECSYTSHISSGDSTDIVFQVSLILNALSPCIYLVLGLNLLLQQTSRNEQVVWTRKVFKSIFVIMLIELLGWGSNSLWSWMQHTDNVPAALDTWIHSSKWINYVFGRVYGYILCITMMLNVPALYLCSTDYRNAFDDQLGRLKKTILGRKFETSNAVGQQQGQTGGWPLANPVQLQQWPSARRSMNIATEVRPHELADQNRRGASFDTSSRNLTQVVA